MKLPLATSKLTLGIHIDIFRMPLHALPFGCVVELEGPPGTDKRIHGCIDARSVQELFERLPAMIASIQCAEDQFELPLPPEAVA